MPRPPGGRTECRVHRSDVTEMTSDASDRWLEECLSRLGGARVGVFGDFCLDAYWLIDPDEGELSAETGLPVWRVREQRYCLGGAGNVAANLAALGVGAVRAVSLVGDDPHGRLMLGLLSALDVNAEGVLACQDDWQTMVFGKPHIGGVEQNRIDFGGFNTVSQASADSLADHLARVAAQCDVVILNQQVPRGVSPPEMIERINAVVEAHPGCRFLVDSRHRAGLYRGAMLKLNAREAAILCGEEPPADGTLTAERTRRHAARLTGRTGRAVFVTRGDEGILVAQTDGLNAVPGIELMQQVDTVGAGDTVAAAIGAVIASGGDALTAARLANTAASVTVRKLHTCGTASPEEMRRVGPNPDYVHFPELADNPRQARMLEGTQFETVRRLPSKPEIRHALFDHDGTVSTLREGWAPIMEQMMVRAILGPRSGDAPQWLLRKVTQSVRSFVDRTTGLQTLSQMQGLVRMVRQFGCVPPDEILDEAGYKAIYNEQILAVARGRLAKLGRGELAVADLTIRNAPAMLERLCRRGVRLYLLSGTDQADVEAEAQALGYAHLFEGRIFGAVGERTVDAKRDVLDRIIRKHDLSGHQFVTFGDGPVEMRQTRKRDGIAVGVASDERRRSGLNAVKRSRLIRAGADLIIPDFGQLDRLLEVLGLAS